MELCSESSIAAMGMVEEGQSQVTTSSKVIKFQEIVEKGDEDRISNLPENLLLEILSRLPSTKDAIRTGTLSKRWKHLWTLVPTLSFKNNAFNRPLSEFFSFVDKTLTQCRQLKLQKFQVSTSYDIGFESQINNWIRYAISCNVEDLILLLWNTKSKAELLLDQSFFTCSSFTDLRLSGRCMLNPTEVISWKNLRSLCIIFGKLDEVVIENILSGSPVLETLVLKSCYGFIRLDITSKSVKNLVLSGYQKYKGTYDDVIIKINAPDILSLKIEGVLNSWKLLLLNVSSLVKADLEYKLMNKFEQIPKEVKEETLKGIILNLHHVKELKVGVYCAKVVSRLAAKGFVVPSNVKASDVTYEWPDIDSSGSDTAENEDL